jgi:hypothetical protein
MSAYDPKRTLATCPKARLSIPIPSTLVAACTNHKADHVEKRDPRGADTKRRKHMELDNDARLEKRTSLLRF